MSFVPKLLSKYAAPSEFDGDGLQVRAISFQVLTVEQITALDGRAPKYPPMDGFVRRFTFEQQSEDGNQVERRIDVNSAGFQRDLQNCGIEKGMLGMLKRRTEGKKSVWTWNQLDEPIVTV